jgi:hypothetical protein
VPELPRIRVPLNTLSKCQIPPRLVRPGGFFGFPWLAPFGLSRGTPVAGFIFIGPAVQVKTVKGNSFHTNSNDAEVWSDLAVEAVLVHAEVARCVPQSDEAWGDRLSYSSCHDIHFLVASLRPMTTTHVSVSVHPKQEEEKVVNGTSLCTTNHGSLYFRFSVTIVGCP